MKAQFYLDRKNRSRTYMLGMAVLSSLLLPGSMAIAADSPNALLPSEQLYQTWKTQYETRGGDAHVIVGLGEMSGLTPRNGTEGMASINMKTGHLTVSVENLQKASDVWLIDNVPGPGKSILPEPGDAMHFIGQLNPIDQKASIHAELGKTFFDTFELDLIVVSPKSTMPSDEFTMLGSRSYMERRYTEERLASKKEGSVDQSISAQSHITTPQSFNKSIVAREFRAHATQFPVATRALLTTDTRAFVHTVQSRSNRKRRPNKPKPRPARQDPRVSLGLVSQQVLDGADLFFRGTFEGNGRTCGTCHEPDNNLVIDPKFIKREKRKNPSNPLFIADRNFPNKEQRVPKLERPKILKKFGLIVENIDGFEDPANKFVMRSVPHTLSLATSILAPASKPDDPNTAVDGSSLAFRERTGWSGDGVFPPGTMRLFPVGAVIQHYTRDLNTREPGPKSFRLQTDDELDKMEAYLLSTGRLNELNLEKVTLHDPRAAEGMNLFAGGACNFCHSNAGAKAAADGRNRTVNTGIETLPNPARQIINFPFDGGHGGTGLSEFNFDTDGNNQNDSYGNGAFNIQPLVEAADTAPFFHNNAFKTIEDAIGFYSTDNFNNSPAGQAIGQAFGPINLTSEQESRVGDFLRTINASFNLDIAAQRIDAAKKIGGKFGLQEIKLTNRLTALANEELKDARQVLKQKKLSKEARKHIRKAIKSNKRVLRSRRAVERAFQSGEAKTSVQQAKEALGSGLKYTMGEGNLVF
jgi:hypothetical protein